MPKREIELSIVIVSFNTQKLTLQCIDSIKKNVVLEHEIIVVDNNSSDDSVKEIKKLKLQNLILIESKSNLGFAKANNLGVRSASGTYILLLNSDTKLKEDSVYVAIQEHKASKNCFAITVKLVGEDGLLQRSGGFFPNLPRLLIWMLGLSRLLPSYSVHPPVSFFEHDRQLDWLSGAFFLVKKADYDSIGGFSEDFFMYVEDVELCYRARKKGKCLYTTKTQITHIGGGSAPGSFAIKNEFANTLLFYRMHLKGQVLVAKMLLAIGALVRMVLSAILGRSEKAKAYFNTARGLL